MPAEAATFVRSWRVGRRTCTMTVPPFKPGGVVHVAMEWEPDLPKCLSADELAQYEAGRNQAISEISSEMGINTAVVGL